MKRSIQNRSVQRVIQIDFKSDYFNCDICHVHTAESHNVGVGK